MTKLFSRVLLLIIFLYKNVLSPWLSPACRFSPSCSEYARQAIIKHGGFRGFLLAIRRIGKCHPWGSSGYDPVP